MCCGAEAGSYLRLIDSCITQLKAPQDLLGPVPSESKEEEDLVGGIGDDVLAEGQERLEEVALDLGERVEHGGHCPAVNRVG